MMAPMGRSETTGCYLRVGHRAARRRMCNTLRHRAGIEAALHLLIGAVRFGQL